MDFLSVRAFSSIRQHAGYHSVVLVLSALPSVCQGTVQRGQHRLLHNVFHLLVRRLLEKILSQLEKSVQLVKMLFIRALKSCTSYCLDLQGEAFQPSD